MELKELLRTGANVTLSVSLNDLRELFEEVTGNQQWKKEEPEPEEFYTRKRVLQVLNIDSSTLWNWEKTGYISSYPFGGRKQYKVSEVEEIRTGKKGKRYGGR